LTIDDLLRDNISEKAVVLTFDDGHISNYKLAFPILKNFNFVATFFIVPMFIGKKDYLTREQILEMHEQGMKFESHSLTHPYMVSLNREEIIREVCESKAKIENLLSNQIYHFSVPYGFYNKCLARCVKDAGYQSLVTENFGYYKYRDNRFHVLPRFTVKSHFDLKNLQDIIEGRKISLLSDYVKTLGIRYLKAILGYRNYIRLKSLILSKTPQHFGNISDYN
jgi:peptidoglycan/xylan/chitin deacetylase (PgdA/CDA1 family)